MEPTGENQLVINKDGYHSYVIKQAQVLKSNFNHAIFTMESKHFELSQSFCALCYNNERNRIMSNVRMFKTFEEVFELEPDSLERWTCNHKCLCTDCAPHSKKQKEKYLKVFAVCPLCFLNS